MVVVAMGLLLPVWAGTAPPARTSQDDFESCDMIRLSDHPAPTAHLEYHCFITQQKPGARYENDQAAPYPGNNYSHFHRTYVGC